MFTSCRQYMTSVFVSHVALRGNEDGSKSCLQDFSLGSIEANSRHSKTLFATVYKKVTDDLNFKTG